MLTNNQRNADSDAKKYLILFKFASITVIRYKVAITGVAVIRNKVVIVWTISHNKRNIHIVVYKIPNYEEKKSCN